VALALLFGCTGSNVTQEQYDTLSTSCAKAKSDSAAALARETAKANAATAQVSACTQEKQAVQSSLLATEQENAALQEKADVLDAAQAKTYKAAQYKLALEYYLDAFGPGKIPNTARLKKIDEQIAVVGDATLAGLISNVNNCQGIVGCSDAKAAVQPYIEAQQQKLMLEAAAIVGAGQQ